MEDGSTKRRLAVDMKVKLEVAANITMIVTGVVATAIMGSQLVRTQFRGPVVQRPAYTAGTSVEYLPIDFTAADQTVVLVLSSDCVFCSRSTPFYRRLIEGTNHTPLRTRVVVIGTEPLQTLAEYVRASAMNVSQVLAVEGRLIKENVTPAMLLVDRKAIVRRYWRGMLPAAGEEDVLRALHALD